MKIITFNMNPEITEVTLTSMIIYMNILVTSPAKKHYIIRRERFIGHLYSSKL